MPQSKYVPQHRGAPARPTLPLSGPVVRGALLGGLALATTGATVGAGTLAADPVVSTPGTTGDPVDVALAAQEESLAGGGSGGGGGQRRAGRPLGAGQPLGAA